MKSLVLIRYVVFVPLFIVSYSLLNRFLSPILYYLFEIFDRILNFIARNDRSFLDRFLLDVVFNKFIISYLSLSIGNYIYPNNKKNIPVIINSIIILLLLIIPIISIYYYSSQLEGLMSESEIKELFDGVSKTKIFFELIGGILGTSIVVYFHFKSED